MTHPHGLSVHMPTHGFAHGAGANDCWTLHMVRPCRGATKHRAWREGPSREGPIHKLSIQDRTSERNSKNAEPEDKWPLWTGLARDPLQLDGTHFWEPDHELPGSAPVMTFVFPSKGQGGGRAGLTSCPASKDRRSAWANNPSLFERAVRPAATARH